MKHAADRVSKILALLLLSWLAIGSIAPSTHAAEGPIAIELNKTEDTEQGCRPLFLLDNRSGHQLNKFQIELVLFDAKGIHLRQILLDMAPLYKDKKVVASFLMSDLPCVEIGSMLVNALPTCANSAGDDLDCLSRLEVTSKSSIPLEK